ncbi:MAG TPA: hypothetical protein VFX59_02580 [Polyangiales bacterium]|nr:hypothetical protein [Polyangiales bacterium]
MFDGEATKAAFVFPPPTCSKYARVISSDGQRGVHGGVGALAQRGHRLAAPVVGLDHEVDCPCLAQGFVAAGLEQQRQLVVQGGELSRTRSRFRWGRASGSRSAAALLELGKKVTEACSDRYQLQPAEVLREHA